MIPKEAYIALAGAVLLAGLFFGARWILHKEFEKGHQAGAAAATAKCEQEISKIQQAADEERRRLGKIALDLGLELAKTDRQRRAIAAKLEEESEREISANPGNPDCAWSDERVRIINDAARGIGQGGDPAR